MREFSRKSRTRLQQTLCAIPIAHVGRGLLFITLTYPRDYPGDWQVWKAQLNHVLIKARRKFPRLGGTWKLEPQDRGAPHFHLLTVGVPFLAADWLRWTWSRILQPGIGPPRNVRIDIQLAKSHRGVVSYASKYVAKAQRLPADWQDGVGRWWGMFGRKNVGIVWRWAPLTQPQYFQAVRVVRRLIAVRARRQSRGPPRAYSAGCWAVLRDWQALRLALCVRASQGSTTSSTGTVDTSTAQAAPGRSEMLDYLYRRPQDAALARQCADAYAGQGQHAAQQGPL